MPGQIRVEGRHRIARAWNSKLLLSLNRARFLCAEWDAETTTAQHQDPRRSMRASIDGVPCKSAGHQHGNAHHVRHVLQRAALVTDVVGTRERAFFWP